MPGHPPIRARRLHVPDGKSVSDLFEQFEPGDYVLQHTDRGPRLWVRLPSGVGPAPVEGYPHVRHTANGPEQRPGWTITEHPDATVTVSPSIHDAPDGWHGFLQADRWTAG